MEINTFNWRSGLSRTVLIKYISDLLLSSAVALILTVLVCHYIGIEKLIESLNHESSVKLLSVFPSPEFGFFDLYFNPETSGLVLLCGFACFVSALILAYCLVHIWLSKTETNRMETLSEKYQNYFIELITKKHDQLSAYFYEDKNEKEKIYLSKDDLLDINKREVLLKELKAMHALINGSEKEKLKEIYYSLGFVDELIEKFKSPDWVERADAVNETAQFEVSKCYLLLRKLMHDSHETVRQNALLARIKLDNNPILILDEISRPLNIWEKHHITQMIKKMPTYMLPSFKNLATKYTIHKDFLIQLNSEFGTDTINHQIKKELA